MENRIKECQLDLFSDRTSTATLATNQLRLWFSSFYLLLSALRRIGLPGTELAQATCGTLRLKLLKLGARVIVSVRRIKIAIASACPHHTEFALAHARLRAPPRRASDQTTGADTERATCARNDSLRSQPHSPHHHYPKQLRRDRPRHSKTVSTTPRTSLNPLLPGTG